jgi:4-hydroxy-tetrahydrodipicolinate reductase
LNSTPLKLLVLGRGKTGGLVSEVAHERGHQVRSIASGENRDAAWLTPENLLDFDVVIDFTTPHAVVANIEACQRERKAMVVGTTGWYSELERIRQAVEKAGSGLVFAANFSYGVNLFFQIVQAAAPALTHNYRGHITERHHVHKKDAPSGTAATLQRLLEKASGERVEVTSEREGDATGTHVLELTSASDHIVLAHEAKSRRTFAEGAVLAAEWIVGKEGFYDFKDVFARL